MKKLNLLSLVMIGFALMMFGDHIGGIWEIAFFGAAGALHGRVVRDIFTTKDKEDADS